MGQDFTSLLVQRAFQREGVQHCYAYNEVKAYVSERAIKTIKKKIYRYFTDIHSYRYIDRLRGFAEGYCQAVHRTIYMPLEDITKDNVETTKRAPCKKIKHLRYRFNIGDSVRRPHLRNIFTLQYDEKWTGEIFTVAQRFWRQSVPVYRIKDYNGEDFTVTFYQSD